MSAIRTFAAAPVDAALSAQFDLWIEEIGPQWPDTRWVPSDARYLTLKFYGQVDPEPLGLLISEIGETIMALPPLEVSVTHIGPFPANARSHIVAAHLSAPEALQRLADGLDSLGASLGLDRRKRAYRPHITLGRQLHRPDTGEAVLRSPFEAMHRIERIGLFRSDTIVDGRAYSEISSFDLTS